MGPRMERLAAFTIASFVLACGPDHPAPPAGGGSGSGGVSSSSSTSAANGTEPTEAGSGSTEGADETSSSGTDSSTGSVACRVGPDHLPRLTLYPLDALSVFGEFPCTVTSADHETDTWSTNLTCEGIGEVRVMVAESFGMLDPSWVGRTLSLQADAQWSVFFGGWYTMRDEDGTLLFAVGNTLPPDGVTDPFTIDWVDQGEACPSMQDCLVLHAHALAFTSEADGTIQVSDGLHEEATDYWIEGASTQWHNPDPPPFGSCEVFDAPSGVVDEFRIIRRIE